MTEAGLAKVERSESYIVGVDDAISPTRLIEQVTLIQNVMKSVMKDGEHFGKIPGCGDKPSLLKPGAEKLCFTFRMDPEFDIEVIDMGKGHREYRVKCTLFAINSGQRLGSGVGSASTMEGKWRFRTGPKELTETIVPKSYWDNHKTDFKKALESIGGKGFSVAKGEDGKWYIATQGEKVEHDNPADVYNTVLKMGKKRAMVDAVLTCTAASDIFTQDVEELVDNGVIVPPSTAAPPVSPPPPAQAPTVAPPATPVGDKEPEKDVLTLRRELAELGQIAVDVGIYPDLGSAIQSFASDEKFQSKCRDVARMNKDWALKKAIKKAQAVLTAHNAPVVDDDIPL